MFECENEWNLGVWGVVNLDIDIDCLLTLYGDSYWRTFWESCKGEMQKGGEGGHVFLVKTEKSDNLNYGGQSPPKE